MLEVFLYSLHLLISEIGVKKQLSNNSGIFAQQMVEFDLFKPEYQKKDTYNFTVFLNLSNRVVFVKVLYIYFQWILWENFHFF